LWYFLIFGIGLLLMWYAINDGNFLFALIIILFAVIIFTHHRTDPLDVMFSVYEAGVQVGDRFFRFRELNSFAVVYEPPTIKQLYIIPSKAVIRKEISIPLGEQNPLHVRSLLLDFIEEDLDREEESSNDKLTATFTILSLIISITLPSITFIITGNSFAFFAISKK